MEEDAFKKWAKEFKYRLVKDELGLFSSTHTQSAWEAWKARAKLDEQQNASGNDPKD